MSDADVKQRTTLAFKFVPVIFANGRDDDLPGFVAALKNEDVQFEDRVYRPGERLVLDRQTLAFSCNGMHIVVAGDDSQHCHMPYGIDEPLRLAKVEPGRFIQITNCTVLWGVKQRP